MKTHRITIVISLLLALVLAACGTGPGEQPPPTGKPGAFQLSGSVECTDGDLSVRLSWTAASGVDSYQLLKDGEALGELTTARTHTDSGPFSASRHTYVVRASNSHGSTDSASWTADIPDCDPEQTPDPKDPEPDPLKAVDADIGHQHALAVMADGRVLSWGTNTRGSLGHPDAPEGEIVAPRFIQGLTDIRNVAAGTSWSLALDTEGVVWSWGRNDRGQLGNGTTTDSHQPQRIEALAEPVSAIAAGDTFALALTESNRVYAWGANDQGQLGSGSGGSDELSAVPVLIDDLEGVQQVAAGRRHALALLADGTVMAWGFNNNGQLGIGTANRDIHAPTTVPALVGVVMVAAGSEHSLALSSDGMLYAWGDNFHGQLGTGDGGLGSRHLSPQEVNLSQAETVVSGSYMSFARDVDGAWWVWGRNQNGQLGDGSIIERDAPVSLVSDLDITSLASGNLTSIAIDNSGRLYAWGLAVSGLVGAEASLVEPTPGPVPGLTDVRQVAGGNRHSLAITRSGDVYAWGDNDRGQLGLGDQVTRLVPTRIEGLTGAIAVAAGYDHSLVLLTGGNVYAFGSNEFGQLGLGTDPADRLLPTEVGGLTGVSFITARGWHSLAVRTGGQVMGWGRNLSYQLGLDDISSRYVPTRIGNLTGITGLSAGSGHTLALASGGLYAWGNGVNGQLGIGERGSRVHSKVPVSVHVLSAPTMVAASHASSFALQGEQLWVWGSDDRGVLGNGPDQREQENPVEQGVLSSVQEVAAGDHYALAVLQDGSVWSWGSNERGQLGTGSNDPEPIDTPVRILAAEGVTAVFTGPEHAFALLQDGTLLGWGLNGNGQLGNGTAYSYTTPQPLPTGH